MNREYKRRKTYLQSQDNEEFQRSLPRTTKWRIKCNEDEPDVNYEQGHGHVQNAADHAAPADVYVEDQLVMEVGPQLADNDFHFNLDEVFDVNIDNDDGINLDIGDGEHENVPDLNFNLEAGERNEGDDDDNNGANDDIMDDDDPADQFLNGAGRAPLYPGSPLTAGVAVYAIMTFALTTHLTRDALKNLLALISLLLPGQSTLPTTLHLFNKCFNSNRPDTGIHYLCPDCHTYIDPARKPLKCDVCDKQYEEKNLKALDGCFFMTSSIYDQLKDIFRHQELSNALNFGGIDGFQGKSYKKWNDKTEGQHITLSLNCDGAKAFNSAPVSIWPFQLSVNELPYHLRKKNTILAGVWCGRFPMPSFHSLLKPLKAELKELNSTTGNKQLRLQHRGEFLNVKVDLIMCPADSPARCKLLNMHQFNGDFGCGQCLTSPITVRNPKGNTTRVYPYVGDALELRTHTKFLADSRKASADRAMVNGVFGISSLTKIHDLNLVDGLPPDPLHALFLGVVKQLAGHWFDSDQNGMPYYIGHEIQQINRELAEVQVTSEITRMPKSLSERKYFKGYEWRTWLLLSAPVLLRVKLPLLYYNHFVKLVDSVYLLSSSSVTERDIHRAENLLKEFVRDFADLYGVHNQTFNVHQCLHLADAVRNWGPLWVFSTALFEGRMRFLVNLFNGTRSVAPQIMRSFTMFTMLQSWCRSLSDEDVPLGLDRFLQNSLFREMHVQKAVSSSDRVTMIGVTVSRHFEVDERYAVRSVHPDVLDGPACFGTKCTFRGTVYHSIGYRDIKRGNYVIETSNGRVGIIISFVLVSCPDGNENGRRTITMALVRYVRHRPFSHRKLDNIRIVTNVSDVLNAVDVQDLVGKNALIRRGAGQAGKMLGPGDIISIIPNLIERD